MPTHLTRMQLDREVYLQAIRESYDAGYQGLPNIHNGADFERAYKRGLMLRQKHDAIDAIGGY